ncbi:MAG: peptide chain release factor N(5)-glutamine methyltransferase [Spiribacter sp.]|nr:peptide chain release factor N(5)-glutamine methyltransferase [Spiribacter sp.]
MTTPPTLAEARRRAGQDLAPVSASPGLDAECLLACATGLARTQFRAHPEAVLEAPAWARFQHLVERRLSGEPVAHLTGHRGFMDFELRVGPAVLIPRPETEHLVEAALERPAASVLDLGCGSGCVAIALARAWPEADIDAVDVSETALSVARANARELGADQIRFHAGDWYTPVSRQHYSLIVSNPPYIGADEAEPDTGDLRFEPRQALIAGPTGLEAIHIVIRGAPAQLHPGGQLWLEHGYRQGPPVREELAAAGFTAIETQHDLAGHERISGGRLEAS